MNRDEANSMAIRLMQTWRGGPALPIWEDALTPMHYRQATTAYERLRDGTDTSPSVRQFKAAYNALTVSDDETGAIKCHGCDGYGWVSIFETHHDREYTASKPCGYCERGKDAKTTVDKINGLRRGEAA